MRPSLCPSSACSPRGWTPAIALTAGVGVPDVVKSEILDAGTADGALSGYVIPAPELPKIDRLYERCGVSVSALSQQAASGESALSSTNVVYVNWFYRCCAAH